MQSNVIKTMKYQLILFLGLVCVLSSCKFKSDYEKIKERELASGVIKEDLFLDLRFGMGRKEFFGTCWEHNKNGILTNGAHYLQVLYRPEVPSGKAVEMNFYPKFEDNQLYYMPIEFLYRDWFPGNEEYVNDLLLEDVLGLMKEWYGEDGFFEVANKEGTISAWVKIEGNRLIRVFKKAINTVRVEILDLRIKDITELNKTEDEAS